MMRANARSLQKRLLQIFVAMSFRWNEEPALIDYFEAIKRATKGLERFKIILNRMDQQPGDYEVSQRMLDVIRKSDLVIADFTMSSHNVYYEVGYAKGLGKRVIHCARVRTDLHFDVRNMKMILFRNATELEELVRTELIALIGTGLVREQLNR
jgi:hypothetical protein